MKSVLHLQCKQDTATGFTYEAHKSGHCYGNDLNGSLLRFFAISSLDKKEFGIFFNFSRAFDSFFGQYYLSKL